MYIFLGVAAVRLTLNSFGVGIWITVPDHTRNAHLGLIIGVLWVLVESGWGLSASYRGRVVGLQVRHCNGIYPNGSQCHLVVSAVWKAAVSNAGKNILGITAHYMPWDRTIVMGDHSLVGGQGFKISFWE